MGWAYGGGSTAAELAGVGGMWRRCVPAKKLERAIYSPDVEGISTRGGPGDDFGREEGECDTSGV